MDQKGGTEWNVVKLCISLRIYRVRTSNCCWYILEPGGSHMHFTGQDEVSLEPHSPHKDFEISHAQIGHS